MTAAAAKRALAVAVALVVLLAGPANHTAGQTGELDVTLRVLDDATGVVAPRIVIPAEPAEREVSSERFPAREPSPPAESDESVGAERSPAGEPQ